MRVSSLSNAKVIDLISKYFVPVWYSRDNYQLSGRDPAEQAEVLRIDRLAQGKGGNVCVFLLDPEGSLVGVQMVQLASKPENLIPFLQRVVEEMTQLYASKGFSLNDAPLFFFLLAKHPLM